MKAIRVLLDTFPIMLLHVGHWGLVVRGVRVLEDAKQVLELKVYSQREIIYRIALELYVSLIDLIA